MASTKWYDELIDFSKNFDHFKGIDEKQKSNIFKKLQELDPDLDPDLYLYQYISDIFNRLCWNYVVGKDLSDKKKEQLKYNNNKKVQFPTYGELEDLLEDFCKNHPQYNGKLEKLKKIKVNKKESINFSNEAVQCMGFVFPNKITCSGELKKLDFRYSIFLEKADFQKAEFSEEADFSNATFSYLAIFSGAKFLESADFCGATFSQFTTFCNAEFSKLATFYNTKFSESADFQKVTFSQFTYFCGATFSKDAYFRKAEFSKTADFQVAIFSETANFCEATFSEFAYFSGATFSKDADFRDARFCIYSYFNNSKFKRGAYFQKVTFCKRVPEFFDAELKEDTSFLGVNWPKKARAYGYLSLIMEELISLIKKIFKKKEANMQARAYGRLSRIIKTLKLKEAQYKEEANMQARAYARLSLIMEDLKRKEDKLFFFTKKMKIQRLLEKGVTYKVFNFCYEKTSNYGNSLTRSFCYFVGTGILFGCFYHWRISSHPCCEVEKVDYVSEAFNVSFSNMLFFSSLLRLQDKEGYLARADCVIKLIKSDIVFRYSGLFQIFLGTIFLFLLLLTLRNKFRTFK